VFLCALVLLLAGAAVHAPASQRVVTPIRLHPDNPHYFLWRGRPTILITSGEHYGAVLNRQFDYRKYLQTLESLGFNLTRTFSGAYCEPFGAFSIENNTLAPKEGQLICPWARSDEPGYANGGDKFDLTYRDPAYFERLSDFVKMTPDNSVVKRGIAEKATARALVEKGQAYAIYINGGSAAQLQVELPKGKYTAEWVNTKTSATDKKETFEHSGGSRTLESPTYEEDIALQVLRSD